MKNNIFIRRYWRGMRLDFKVGLIALLLFVIISTISHWNSRTNVKHALWEREDGYAQSLTNTAAVFAADPLSKKNFQILREYANNLLKSQNQIVVVRLLTKSNQLEFEIKKNSVPDPDSAHIRYFFSKIFSPINSLEPLGSVILGFSTLDSQRSITSELHFLLLDTVISFLVLLLTLVWVLKHMVWNPVRSLEKQATSLGKGHLTTPISLESEDELGRLAASLDLMRIHLKESHDVLSERSETLEKLSRTLENKVLERTQALTDSYALLEQELARRQEADIKLRAMHHQTDLILSTAGEGIFGVDQEGLITFINPAAGRMLGWTPDELLGKRSHALIHHTRQDGSPYPDHDCRVCSSIKEKVTRRVSNEVFWRKDGTHFAVEYACSPILDDMEIKGGVVVFRDITDRKAEEDRELHSQISRIAISALLETGLEDLTLEHQLEVALDIILAVSWLSIVAKGSIFLTDPDTGELVLLAQRNLSTPLLTSCARIPIGYCLCGRAAESRQIVFSSQIDERHDVTFDGIKPHGHYCIPILSRERLLGVLNLYLPDGHPRNPEEDAFLTTIANTLAGIIERRQIEKQLRDAEEKLRQKAHHDTLTGLPNRLLFQELLQRSLAQVRREGRSLAVLFMDLDHFKKINDNLGHEAGDLLLVEVAKRICACMREGDTVARLGGDEFTLILQEPSRRDDIVRIVQRIIEQIRKPFLIKDQECHVGASVGIALHPEHGRDPITLLKKADQAMYLTKNRQRNGYTFYEPDAAEVVEVE
ncbi:MAG: diguanylate cyclase [Magnetococcus sp. DMHC-1]